MKIQHEILVNKYGQGIAHIQELKTLFETFEIDYKKVFLNDIIHLIIQSKAKDSDIEPAIKESGLKSTLTPCVLLRKGVANHNLQKLLELPSAEMSKSFTLLLGLFKIAYTKKFEQEKNDPNKWWYWDLSDQNNIDHITKKYNKDKTI